MMKQTDVTQMCFRSITYHTFDMVTYVLFISEKNIYHTYVLRSECVRFICVSLLNKQRKFHNFHDCR